MIQPMVIEAISGTTEKAVMASAAKRTILASGYLLSPAARALAVVEDRHLLAADPRHHAADEAMALGHRQQDVEHAPRHQAEVAGIERDVDVGHAADQAVEGGGGGALEQALAVALAALAVDHVGALIHQRHHVGQQLGRILQVGVDDQDALAAAHREAGGERQLVAVVAHQPHRDDARVRGRRRRS